MEPILAIQATMAPLPRADIDTDRAKGRGARIIKRNSHITVRVADED